MADTTITIPAGSWADRELERIASENGHSKAEIALEALAEWLEDQADYLAAKEVLERNEPTISLAEMKRKYDLEG